MTAFDALTRRSLMGLIGASAVVDMADIAIAAPKPATGKSFDYASPADRLKIYMMTKCALDDRVVIRCSTGRYYGVIDADMIPLHDIAAVTFSRHRLLPSGAYEVVSMEQAYYTDIETGKVITSLRNPYTGETVEVPGTGVPPGKGQIMPDLTFRPGHQILPIVVRGDDVWLSEESKFGRVPPGQTKPFNYHEVVTYHARRSDLEAPGAKHVDCVTSFTAVMNWRPWMNMGDRPGQMMVIAAGRSGANLDAMPPGWIEETARVNPILLTNPQAALDAVWNAPPG